MDKPFIVAVDGVDYSGKSEVIARVSELLNDRLVKVFKFPSTEHYGRLARDFIAVNSRDPEDLAKTAHCLTSDFANTPLKFIEEHMHDEHRPVVFYDRYLASALASQGRAAYNTIFSRALELEYSAPEVYFLLRNTYEEAVKRSETRVKHNWDAKLESSFMCSKEAYDAQSEAYLSGFNSVLHRFKETSCVIIDASQPLDKVVEDVCSYLIPLLQAGSNHYVSPIGDCS